MPADTRLLWPRFPRASRYHPDWMIAHCCGSPALALAEWLAADLDLRPGQRILDLGCGFAATSIFLAREFDVQVWAADLWFPATRNHQRIRDAGLDDRIFPFHADAHSLPFAGDFFDAVLCIDAYSYFGTDDLYLNYLAHFVKPGGLLALAGAGLVHERDGPVPDHLRDFWTQDFWCLHSAAWWRRHWERTGIVDILFADSMPDGPQAWLDWQRTGHPENTVEIEALEADAGRTFTYVRQAARRRPGVPLQEYCWPDTLRSMPIPDPKSYPLLRDPSSPGPSSPA